MSVDESVSKIVVADANEEVALDYEADEEQHESGQAAVPVEREADVEDVDGAARVAADGAVVVDEGLGADEGVDADEAVTGGYGAEDGVVDDDVAENGVVDDDDALKGDVAKDDDVVADVARDDVKASDVGESGEDVGGDLSRRRVEAPSPSEELEEGELSDEERLKPAPVCRFYNRGHCTWGNQCRFLHPGIMDKGNYNMFEEPRPILPGLRNEHLLSDPNTGLEEDKEKTEPVSGPMTRIESAWERGLRQAKEMRRKSQLRKETDMEYEEKRTAMSLTQAELDNENYYYAKPASPVHEPSFLGNNEFSDFDNDDFDDHINNASQHRGGTGQDDKRRRRRDREDDSRERRRSDRRDSSRTGRREEDNDGDNRRRVTRPSKGNDSKVTVAAARRVDRADKWADPWMRHNDPARRDTRRRPRRDSSEESSRSSSSSSSASSRGSHRRRRNPSSMRFGSRRGNRSSSSSSSRSSSIDERVRARSIKRSPTRASKNVKKALNSTGNGALSGSNAAPLQRRLNTAAPLQKRLTSQLTNANVVTVKKENMNSKESNKANATPKTSVTNKSQGRPLPFMPSSRNVVQESNRSKDLMNKQKRPALPPVLPMDEVFIKSESAKRQSESHQQEKKATKSASGAKPQIRMTLKTNAVSKPNVNHSVLMKLNQDDNAQPENEQEQQQQREEEQPEESVRGEEQTKVQVGSKRKSSNSENTTPGKTKKSGESKRKKSAADRKEELLKQLRAVEEAIAKKRTKVK